MESLLRSISNGQKLSAKQLAAFSLYLHKDCNNCEDIYLVIDIEKGKCLSDEVAVAVSEWKPMSNQPANVIINVENLSDGAAHALSQWRILNDSADEPSPRFAYHGCLYLTELRTLSEKAAHSLLASKSFLVINPKKLDPAAVQILRARKSAKMNGDLQFTPLSLKKTSAKKTTKKKK